jgi:hypothetical protein
MTSSHKTSPSVFKLIRDLLHRISGDLENVSEDELQQIGTVIPEIITHLCDLNYFTGHVDAAQAFIWSIATFQIQARVICPRMAPLSVPPQCHQLLIGPSTLKVPSTEKVIVPQARIQEALDSLSPSNIGECSERIRRIIESTFVFQPPVHGIQGILSSLVTLKIPYDSKTRLFAKFVQMVQIIGQCFEELYQLPIRATGLELNKLRQLLEKLEQEVETIVRARKRPQTWTAERLRTLSARFEEFSIACRNVLHGYDVIDIANTMLGGPLLSLDLSDFKLRQVRGVFTLPKPTCEPTLHRLNVLRTVNAVVRDLQGLRKAGYALFNELSPQKLRAVSVAPVLQKIKTMLVKIQVEMFKFVGVSNIDFPVPKTGTWVLSYLADLERNLESILLSADRIPLVVINIRIYSLLLFCSDYPQANDGFFETIMRDMSSLFDYYAIIAKMENIGSVSLSSVMQISFLTTVCDELESYNPIFGIFRNRFLELNLFDFPIDPFLMLLRELQQEVYLAIGTWKSREMCRLFAPWVSVLTEMKASAGDTFIARNINSLADRIERMLRIQPDYSTVREVQMRITLLSLAGQLPDQHFSPLKRLIVDFDRIFQAKRHLTLLLDFLDRIPSPDDEILRSRDHPAAHELPKVAIPEKPLLMELSLFPPPEFRCWDRFTEVPIFPIFSRTSHAPIDSLSASTLWAHFRDCVECYPGIWHLDATFSSEAIPLFAPLLENTTFFTIPDLQSCFAAFELQFSQFYERVPSILRHAVEDVSRMLSELAPLSARGRPAVREAMISHAQATVLAEDNKALQQLAVRFTDLSFSWFPELLLSFKRLSSILEAAVTATEAEHPYSVMRRLYRTAFACYLVRRCHQAITTGQLQFRIDFQLLRFLLANFLDNHALGLQIAKRQIDEIFTADITSSLPMCEAVLRNLRHTCGLIDIRVIVDMIDSGFFNFTEFFAAMPSNISSFISLISSKLIHTADQTKRALFELLADDYCERLGRQSSTYLHRFMAELSPTSFRIDANPILSAIRAVRTYESLCDLAIVFDCIDCFLPQSMIGIPVHGSVLTRIRVLVFLIHNRIGKLVATTPIRYQFYFTHFMPILKVLCVLPTRFGLIGNAQDAVAEFCDAWRTFCENFIPFPIDVEHEEFHDASQSIIETLTSFHTGSSEAAADVQHFEILIDRFNLTRDPALLFRLSLALSFVEQQASRYCTVALPVPAFSNSCRAIQVLSLIHDSLYLIRALTTVVNNSLCGENPIGDPVTLLTEKQVDISSDTSGLKCLKEQLPLVDQTALLQLVRTIGDANQTEQERLVSLPFINEDVAKLSPVLTRMADENASLEALNRVLGTVATAAARRERPPPEKDRRAERELAELQARDDVVEEQCAEAEERYRTALERLQEIDTTKTRENGAKSLRMAMDRLQMERSSACSAAQAIRATFQTDGLKEVVTVARDKEVETEQEGEKEEEEESEEQLRLKIGEKLSIVRRLIDVLNG